MSSLALRLPLLEGARFAAAGVQVPCALLLLPGRPLLCSSAQTTHWSLSSSLSTLDFPVLWGSLGGIFGLEGGEPDLLLTQLRPDREGTEEKLDREKDKKRARERARASERERAREMILSY